MTPFAIPLRPYQQEAIDAIFSWFGANTGNPLVVLPTGAGKSLVAAGFIHRVLSQWPKERILVVTHVRELIAQNHAALLKAWPAAPAGIYSAGLGKREHEAQVLFAGIQSIADKANKIGWCDLVIVDEAHLIPASGMGRYRTLFDALSSMNPNLKIIGLTATPFRTDSGSLDKGEDRMFHGTCYDAGLVRMIDEKWLSPIVSKGTKATIDTSSVHVRGGEFVESELSDAAMDGDLVPRAVAEVVMRGVGRKSWLLFCCGIDHANAVHEELGKHGIVAATVFGDTKRDERDQTLADFKAGKIQAIANVGVLTTGFDAPGVDLIALLRPTMSPGLFVQMVGRGLRKAPGKADCLVLDFGGNVLRHGPINNVKVKEPGDPKNEDEILARECPECLTLVPIDESTCPDCGYIWPAPKKKNAHAIAPEESVDIIERRNPVERWTVLYQSHGLHQGKDGKPNTLRVEYEAGINMRVSEWICFEHEPGSFPRRKAAQWWADRGGHSPTPVTIDLALCRIESGELRKAATVVVDTRERWPKLLSVKLAEEEAGTIDYGGPVDSADFSDLPF